MAARASAAKGVREGTFPGGSECSGGSYARDRLRPGATDRDRGRLLTRPAAGADTGDGRAHRCAEQPLDTRPQGQSGPLQQEQRRLKGSRSRRGSTRTRGSGKPVCTIAATGGRRSSGTCAQARRGLHAAGRDRPAVKAGPSVCRRVTSSDGYVSQPRDVRQECVSVYVRSPRPGARTPRTEQPLRVAGRDLQCTAGTSVGAPERVSITEAKAKKATVPVTSARRCSPRETPNECSASSSWR